MLAPLKANMELSTRLFRRMKTESDRQLAQTINISCNMLLLHAHDLLDQRIIENGSFSPHYTQNSAQKAIQEMVDLVQLTLDKK